MEYILKKYLEIVSINEEYGRYYLKCTPSNKLLENLLWNVLKENKDYVKEYVKRKLKRK